MAVSDSVQLPEQPTSGFTRTQPLGGNGWSDPHSRTTCRITLASAAGGGTNILIIRLDPRYTQLVAFVNVSVAGATVDPSPGRVELDCGGGGTVVSVANHASSRYWVDRRRKQRLMDSTERFV